MNDAMSLETLIDHLSILLATQSPHLPTNVTEIKLSDGYRTVELHGAISEEVEDLEDEIDSMRSQLSESEEECGKFEQEAHDLRRELAARDSEIEMIAEERDSARSEVLKLQQDIIDLGQQLNAVLSR